MLGKLPNGGKKRENGTEDRGKKRKEGERKKNVEVKVEGEKEVGVYIFNSNIVLAVRILSSRKSAPAFFNYYSRLNAPVILSYGYVAPRRLDANLFARSSCFRNSKN